MFCPDRTANTLNHMRFENPGLYLIRELFTSKNKRIPTVIIGIVSNVFVSRDIQTQRTINQFGVETGVRL